MIEAPRQCVILVGGLGTRLGALTAAASKPLLGVGGRPFLEYLLREAARFGFRQVLLLAGWRSEDAEAYLADGGLAAELGLTIQVSREHEPAGTGGALWRARHLLDEWFYLLNGDSWFDFNWLSLLTTDGAERATATLGLRRIEDAGRYGVVETEGARVRRFLERPMTPGPAAVNGGVYLVSRRIVSHLRERCSLERDCFPWLAASGDLRGRLAEGRFIDIGIPTDFALAQTLIPAWRRRPAVFLDSESLVGGEAGSVHFLGQPRCLPGAAIAVRQLNDAGFYVFVLDQSVTRAPSAEGHAGLYREAIQAQLRPLAAHIDDFGHGAAHPDEEQARGGLVDLIERWPLDIARSVIIARRLGDLQAGRAAGLRTIQAADAGLADAVEGVMA